MSVKKLILCLILATSFVACDKKKQEAPKEPEKAVQEEKKEEPKEAVANDDADFPIPFIAKGPVVVVNSVEVTPERFAEQVAPIAKIAQQIPLEQLDRVKDDVVNRLIDDELIRQKLADRIKAVTPEALEEERTNFIKQFPSEEQYKQMLENMNMSEDALKEQMRLAVAMRGFLQDEYNAKVSDEDIKKYYDANKAQYEHKEQVHARHILLNLKADAPQAEADEVKKKALEIEKEAKADGADFAKLAEKYSEGPTKSRGGDLGYFEAERMVPEFSKAAFALKPGEVSDPVRTQFGYHIIKVEDKKAAGTDSFDDVKDNIKEMLEMQKLSTEAQNLIRDLRAKATIERKDGDNVVINPEFEKKVKAAQEAAGGNQALPPGLQLQGAGGEELKLKLNNQ